MDRQITESLRERLKDIGHQIAQKIHDLDEVIVKQYSDQSWNEGRIAEFRKQKEGLLNDLRLLWLEQDKLEMILVLREDAENDYNGGKENSNEDNNS